MGTRPTLAQAARLPASLTLPEAAALLGIGRTHAYTLAATGQFPAPVLHLGRALRVPTAPLLRLLAIPDPTAPAPDPTPGDPVPGAVRGGAREEPPPHHEEPS
jgi:predicted DNA-binding transcriptional regulator AlpA